MKKETIYKEDALKVLAQCHKYCIDPFDSYHIDIEDAEARIRRIPPAQPKYVEVKAEDFAKTMSENTIYSFMAWHGEALKLMEKHGFVICKKKRYDLQIDGD